MIVGWALPHQADAIFEKVSEGFEEASKRSGGQESAAHLWQMCRNGSAFLLSAIEGTDVKMASVWQFQQWNGDFVFRCISLTGTDMSEWIGDARKLAEDRARLGGASRIVTEGRKGWKRLFDDAREIRRVYEVTL